MIEYFEPGKPKGHAINAEVIRIWSGDQMLVITPLPNGGVLINSWFVNNGQGSKGLLNVQPVGLDCIQVHHGLKP